MWREIEFKRIVGWVNARFLKPTNLYLEAPAALKCGGTEPFWNLEIGGVGGAYASPEAEGPIQFKVQRFARGIGRTDLWAHYLSSLGGVFI